MRDSARREKTRILTREAHKVGIKDVLVWDHTFYDLDYYPSEFKVEPEGKINLDDPLFWEWYKQDYRELMAKIPEVDGLVLTFIETGAHIEAQHSDKLKDPSDKLSAVVDTLSQLIINELGKKLYVRTFVHRQEQVPAMIEMLSKISHPDIKVMVKEVSGDFFFNYPTQKYVEQIKQPVYVEFDCGHEYHGQGATLNTFTNVLTDRWKYYLNKKNVIGYVARIDRYGNTSIIDQPGEVLLHTLRRLAQDTSLTNDVVTAEFISQQYTAEAVKPLMSAFARARDICESSMYTLGLYTSRHSLLNYEYAYWGGFGNSKQVYRIGAPIHKEFVFDELVTRMAPEAYKAIVHPDYVQAEMLDFTLFEYIMEQKKYAVDQSAIALEEVRSILPQLPPSKADQLHQLFYRTWLVSRLHWASSALYFGRRLELKGEEEQLKAYISEALVEIDEVGTLVSDYDKPYPSGQYDFKEDAKMAFTYKSNYLKGDWLNSSVISK